MDGPSSLETALGWIWSIEYIASFPEIDISILSGLMEAAPELPYDLGKNMREMVSLRCLEELFGGSDGINDVPSQEPKDSLDFSESCESVLQSLLKEISEPGVGPEVSKWDVDPFIMHKRATLPKCFLEKVKEAILDGTHPYALLKEHSGLVSANDGHNRNPTGDSNIGATTSNPNANNSDI